MSRNEYTESRIRRAYLSNHSYVIPALVLIVFWVALPSASHAQPPPYPELSLAELYRPHWERHMAQSREAHSPFEPNWRPAITPPFPVLVSNDTIAFIHYVYALGHVQGGGPTDSDIVARPWAAIRTDTTWSTEPQLKLVSLTIQRLGVQGTMLDIHQETRFRPQNPYTLSMQISQLYMSPANPDPVVESIREHYCLWARHNGVIAEYLRQLHADFFQTLNCGF